MILLALFLVVADAPPLPKLALDSYPPEARNVIAAADQRARAHPNDPDAVGALAMTLHAWDQWDAAHAAYLRAQSLRPSAEWIYLDGVVLQRLGRPADAVKRFMGLPHLPARLRLADALFDAGAVEESARAFAALAEEPAAGPAVAFGRGRLAAQAGRHAEAIAFFDGAIALFPEYGAAHYARAMSLRALGRREDAQAALASHRQFGARWPAVEDPILRKIEAAKKDDRALLQRALQQAEAGDIQGAIASHEAALARDPAIAQARTNLISLYGRTRNWEKAEEHYRAVVKLGLHLDEAHYNYGVLLGLQDRWNEAAEAYRDAIRINPSHAEARNNLGSILEREKQIDAATEQYRLAAEAQPRFRLARFNLARMLIARGRNDDAIAELEKVLEPKDAEAPRYVMALATAHVRAGRRDVGVRLAREARDLAVKFGQRDLAAAIDRDLQSLAK